MDYQDITVQTLPGRVGLVTLNRPKALNALHGQLMTELTRCKPLTPMTAWGQS